MMIQTLRITSVIVGILAAVLVWFSVSHGIEKDAEVRDLLSAKDVIERLEDQIGKSNTGPVNTQSPLVQEAQRYATLVNPPVKQMPQPPVKPGPDRKGTIAPISPRLESSIFSVIGTCVNAEDPNASLAYIRETGKGEHWVRQKDVLGRFVIEEVLDGVVTLRNGQVLTEERVAAQPRVSLIDDGRPGSPSLPTSISDLPTRAVAAPVASGQSISVTPTSRLPRSVTQRAPRGPMSPSDTQELAKVVEQLNSMTDRNESNKTPEQIEEDRRVRDEVMRKMMDQMNKNGSGSRNAADLDDLKKRLLSGQK